MYYKGQLVCEWNSASERDSLTGEEPCGISGCFLRASKSASVSSAYIHDTITFCITVTSTAQDDLETYIWDTIPANTTYIGCDNGCTYSGGMVSWFVAIAPGYSATRCFWVRITGYPFLYMERERFAGVNYRQGIREINAVYRADSFEYWLAVNRYFRSQN